MAFYIRILGFQNPDIHLDAIKNSLSENNFSVKYQIFDGGVENKWHDVQISDSNGDPLVALERSPVIKGELGKEELEEFKRDIQNFKPRSAVKWLNKNLEKVKVIYAIELYEKVFEDQNYNIIGLLKNIIQSFTGGFFQADDEGFYNENDDLILWQFPEDVSGKWDMAVLDARGMWTSFQIELSNKQQVDAFQNGLTPVSGT